MSDYAIPIRTHNNLLTLEPVRMCPIIITLQLEGRPFTLEKNRNH